MEETQAEGPRFCYAGQLLGVSGLDTISWRFFVLFCFVFINLFIYLSMAVLGLHCCARAFSSCGELGATLRCGARAAHCGGFSCCGAQALGARASVVVAQGL